MIPKLMKLKWAKKCEFCGEEIAVGNFAYGENIIGRWYFQCPTCHNIPLQDRLSSIESKEIAIRLAFGNGEIEILREFICSGKIEPIIKKKSIMTILKESAKWSLA